VLLEQLPFEYGRARRRLRVVKYRGVPAIEGFHDFAIRRGGLSVFPQLRPGVRAASAPAPIRSGLDELDELVGGGLTGGTTTLFLGPAGSGKSTLAGRYLSSGAGSGPSALYLFDERLRTFTDRCDALGMRMSEKIRSGDVIVEQVEPGELSPGEFSHRVSEVVEQRGVRMVMIDSMNGYLHAIPQSDSPLARMHELLSYLNEREVATLIVLAQHGVVGTAMSTPLDVSYLADCVMMLRFFESQGAVRRAISVVKKRTGLHETTIRELHFAAGNVRVGEALTSFEGVLTGVPRYTGDRPLM
jgi:circadian clock protein KaiC